MNETTSLIPENVEDYDEITDAHSLIEGDIVLLPDGENGEITKYRVDKQPKEWMDGHHDRDGGFIPEGFCLSVIVSDIEDEIWFDLYFDSGEALMIKRPCDHHWLEQGNFGSIYEQAYRICKKCRAMERNKNDRF